MILLVFMMSVDTCTVYSGSQEFNPTITINNPQTVGFAYLAYLIEYVKNDINSNDIKYVYTSVTAEQKQIIVTVYGRVKSICTMEKNNIMLMSSVTQIANLSNLLNIKINTEKLLFIDSEYVRCDRQNVEYEISSSSHGQLLTLYYGAQDLSILHDFPKNCFKRKFFNITPENGIMIAEQNDIIYPVYNANLSLYNKEYGNFLYPMITINLNETIVNTPTYPLQQGDKIVLMYSIIFGNHPEYQFENEIQQILIGVPYIEYDQENYIEHRNDGFENVTILNKCVQFVANSPRNIEYPLNSGIIFSIQDGIPAEYRQYEGPYQQYFSPLICVENFTFMPAMFYTAEDPALKEIFNNLTNIKNSFEKSVKDGSWSYLTNDKTANETAYNYTRDMIQALNDMCLKVYFSDAYLFNLSKCLIFVFCPLIGINIIMSTYRKIVKAKADKKLNQPATQVVKKKAMSVGYMFSILSFVVLILLIFIKSNKLQLSLIFIIGVLYIIFRGMKNYKEYQNTIFAGNNTQIGTNQQKSKQQIHQKRSTFWIQYFIVVVFRALDIIQTVTDIMQILQYLQIQYYQNRTSNIIFLMYPSQKILQAAQYLAQNIAYPLILLGISLINQEIMKQEWFKKCITPSSDPLDNKTFLIKLLIYVFSYCQGFIYNVFFAFTYTKFTFQQINNSTIQYNLQVILKIFLSGTIYSISKFQLILEYYQQLNKAAIKVFTHIVQILSNVILIVVTILVLFIHTLQCKGQAIKVQMKILIISIFNLVYYVMMLIIDPIVTILAPTSLMFQELTNLCPFILQVIGICDHQDEFAKQTENLLKIDVDKFWQNILSSVEVYGISIFFGLMFSKDQDKSIQPKDQWHAIFFGVVTFITPYVLKNYIAGQVIPHYKKELGSNSNTNELETIQTVQEVGQGQVESQVDNRTVKNIQNAHNQNNQPEIDQFLEQQSTQTQVQNQQVQNLPFKKEYKIKPFTPQYKIIELQCQLTEGECEYHKSLLTVRGDYKHEAGYYEDFLKGLIFTGYGIIPGFGIILATVAKYMNNTGLACDGKSIIMKSRQEITRTVINIIADLVQIVLIIIGICLALTTENTVAYATIIAFYIFFYYFQLLDKQLQVAYGYTVDHYFKKLRFKKTTAMVQPSIVPQFQSAVLEQDITVIPVTSIVTEEIQTQ
ncbi:Conserved_hypothetical protein [Hexamita inflata]|uniref:Uncharacterized protein n=1 Tax=Hexamita inflata TaxID=28002 RepID=A0AA86PMD7_9EUKA|nr:Conserved hypothetical protein [Hexamita inflata]